MAPIKLLTNGCCWQVLKNILPGPAHALSFSILLQDKNVDDATVAYLMGHTTTEQVRKTYKRHWPKDQMETIKQLPTPEQMPYYLKIPK